MFAMVLDALPMRVFWKDRDGRFLGCNELVAKDAGYSRPEDMIGLTDFDLHAPDLAAAYRADDMTVIDMNTPKLGIIERHGLRSGEQIWVETNKIPLRDESGAVQGVLGTYHDVSPRVAMQDAQARLIEDAIRARREAEEANAAKTLFLANVSHELRTPLNAIIGYGELLVEETMDGGAARVEDLHRIIGPAHGLLRLINELLDLSKLEFGGFELDSDDFDPSSIVRSVVEIVGPSAREADVSLSLSVAHDLGSAHNDAHRLRQCLLNLVSNAIKFSPGGSIAVRAWRERRWAFDMLAFEVADTGIGMTSDQAARLFQPFVQADASVSRRHGGTGLGLAITKGFAELMGGEIAVRSTPLEGSVFTLVVRADLAASATPFALSA
jgi:PAS domain S-box-containing protein